MTYSPHIEGVLTAYKAYMQGMNISLKISDDDQDVAYLYLPGHPENLTCGCVVKQIRLSDVVAYVGPDLYLDLDASGRLIGLEILV